MGVEGPAITAGVIPKTLKTCHMLLDHWVFNTEWTIGRKPDSLICPGNTAELSSGLAYIVKHNDRTATVDVAHLSLLP